MIPLHIIGGAVLTYRVAGAVTTTALEFVPVPGLEGIIAYILYTDDSVSVMQERVTSVELASTGGKLSYTPMAYLGWQSVSRSPGPLSLYVERAPVSITVSPDTGKGGRETRCRLSMVHHARLGCRVRIDTQRTRGFEVTLHH